MLSSVLNSKIASQINVAVVKAFIEMRRYIAKPIRKKLDDLEKVLRDFVDDPPSGDIIKLRGEDGYRRRDGSSGCKKKLHAYIDEVPDYCLSSVEPLLSYLADESVAR